MKDIQAQKQAVENRVSNKMIKDDAKQNTDLVEPTTSENVQQDPL